MLFLYVGIYLLHFSHYLLEKMVIWICDFGYDDNIEGWGGESGPIWVDLGYEKEEKRGTRSYF